jgi:hypothetical protein
MSFPSTPNTPTATAESQKSSHVADIRLYGRRLVLARVAWVTVLTLIVALFLVMLPAFSTLLQTVCTGASCGLVQPTPGSARAMQQLGLSIGAYATIPLALTIASEFLCLAVGAVIYWRKSDDWMALLVALSVVALGTVNVTSVLQVSSSPWQVLAIVLNILGNGLFFLVCSLFPNGRFVPRWTRWLLPCWVVSGLVFLFSRDVYFSYLVHVLVWLAVVILLVIALLYRYHFASSPLQRQQAKWVIFGASLAGSISVGLIVPTFLFPAHGQAGSFYQVISQPAYILDVLIIPISLGLAILRYRLWDIDIIIRRTLVYGALTVILTGVYVGLVIGLQALLRHIINQSSGVAIVLSTLTIAVLFQPLRRRIQRIIDRRFYRSKYDAAKTVAAFSATVRNEVDLDQLREDLVAVVQETMQPAHISLWLPPPAPGSKRQAMWNSTSAARLPPSEQS